MDKDLIERLADESGLTDPDLSRPGLMMTDYGNAEEAVRRFAALVADSAVEFLIDDGRIHENYADDARATIRAKFQEPG